MGGEGLVLPEAAEATAQGAVAVEEVRAETEQARIASDERVQLARIEAEGELQGAAIEAEGERQAARIEAEGAQGWQQEAASIREEMREIAGTLSRQVSVTPPQREEVAGLAAETVLEVLTPEEEAPDVADLPAASPDPPPPPPPPPPPAQSPPARARRRGFL